MTNENENKDNNTSTDTVSEKDDKNGQGKTCAILAYLLIGIIWYFVDEKIKKDDFAKFHVKQALVLMIASFAGSLLFSILWVFCWLIPFYQLIIIVGAIIGMINASNGKKEKLPLIGQFGDKFTF